MPSEFVLDPVSGIPDPPTDESMILEWASELTKSLQKDHVANVDRTETMVMMNRGLDTRPASTGSRRFFHDARSGILYLDTEINPGYSEWVGINEVTSYSTDGLGVHVLLTTSLPWSTSTSGYFSWDDESWDAVDSDPYYWESSDPTVITVPETRSYQIVIEGKFDNLTEDGEWLSGIEINGTSAALEDDYYQVISEGTSEEYTIRIAVVKALTLDDEIKIGYVTSDSVDVSELSCTVTPVTLQTGGGGEPPGLSEHSELSGLTAPADDHTQYMLWSDYEASRAAFGTKWTDLTDGGATTLHYHSPLYLDNNDSIFWRNAANSDWLSALKLDGSDDFYIGIPGGTNDTYIRGQDVYIDVSQNFEVDAAADIVIDSASDIDLIASDFLYLDGVTRLKDNGDYLWGRISTSATYNQLIGMSTDNMVEVGSSSRNTWVHGNGVLRLGDFGCPIYLEDSASGTWVDSIGYESYAHDTGTVSSLGLGHTGRGIVLKGTYATLAASQQIHLTSTVGVYLETHTGAGSDIVLDSNDKTYLTSVDDIVMTTPMVDMAAADDVRLPVLSAPPTGVANGSIWMESDGLHIYYGGSEYTVAGV